MGYEEIVKLLLEAKANVNSKGKDGWMPLLWAAAYGYEDIIKLQLTLSDLIQHHNMFSQLNLTTPPENLEVP